MKKYILTFIITLALFVPSFSHAQTIDKAQYVSLLQQMITLLQQELQILIQNQQSLNTIASSTAQIVANNPAPVSTGGSTGDNVGGGTITPEPSVSWQYNSNNGYLVYTGTYEVKPENIWFSYKPAKEQQQAWNKSGSTIVDETQSNGMFVERISFDPSIQSQLSTSANTVMFVQSRFPGVNYFGNVLEFDTSGNQITYINGD